MQIQKEVNAHFQQFIGDWEHKFYFLLGGYGSSKSYHVAVKIILKCLAEKRKVLVVREVYETIRESCFSLFEEIGESLGLLDNYRNPVMKFTRSPMKITFRNGSEIIFRGHGQSGKAEIHPWCKYYLD